MKIYINTQLKEGAWGGGNQFLKALRGGLSAHDSFTENRVSGDVVLFNGYQDVVAIFSHWLFHYRQKRMYRLGPILSLHRFGLKWKTIDHIVVLFANLFADLVVFQSQWSYNESLRRGFSARKQYVVIGNAVDPSIFTKKEWQEKKPNKKTHLIYTSWSPNMKKGFSYITFLDEHLDFSRYEFTFIGNTPRMFKHIQVLSPLASMELAAKLREADIFVSPTRDDACSNALLEGLSSGLPVAALDSGGNAELVRAAGQLFKTEQDLLRAIDEIAKNLKYYYDRIEVKGPETIAKEYIQACNDL